MLFHKKRFYKRARLAPVSLSGFLSHHVIPFAHAPTMADIIYHDDLTKDQTYETTQPWTFSLQNCEITLLKSTPTSSTFVIATKNRTIQPLKSPCQKLPLLVIWILTFKKASGSPGICAWLGLARNMHTVIRWDNCFRNPKEIHDGTWGIKRKHNMPFHLASHIKIKSKNKRFRRQRALFEYVYDSSVKQKQHSRSLSWSS